MSFRGGIFPCALPAVALGLLPLAAAGQREDEPETVILSHEEGTIVVGRDSGALPWARSSSGPLVALGPVVEALGGDLEVGPLGEAHTLRVAGREAVLGPLSRTVLIDGEVRNLSIRPWIEPEPEYPDEGEPAAPRRLFVPVDALARAYPETLGYRFDFDRRRGQLQVRRADEPRIDVEVDRVHDLGATTLVVTFSRRPRYQVERHRGGVRLRLLSGVMDPRRRVRLNDPLARWVEVRERSVDIGLAPGAAASEPYLLGRPPQVRLVLDVTRRRPELEPRATPRVEGERREFRIVLDPGHGGTDNGVRAPSGESEKNLALRIAEALGSYLESELGARVVLARDGDSTVTLENRTSLANQYEADIFLSLHLSAGAAALPGSVFQTWVLDPPPAPFEEETAEPEAESAAEDAPETPPSEAFEDENPDDLEPEPAEEETLVAIPPLELWDRAHDGETERSALLARLIQTRVGDLLDLPNRGFQRAPLRVLTGASMPAVLIEFGYEEVERERTPVFDGPRGSAVFEAIVQAIRLYRDVVAGAAETTADGTPS